MNKFKYLNGRKHCRKEIIDLGKINGFSLKKGKPLTLEDEIDIDIFNIEEE